MDQPVLSVSLVAFTPEQQQLADLFPNGALHAYLRDPIQEKGFRWQTVAFLLQSRESMPSFGTLAGRLRQGFPEDCRIQRLLHAIAVWDLCRAIDQHGFTPQRVAAEALKMVKEHQLDGQQLRQSFSSWCDTRAFYEVGLNTSELWASSTRLVYKAWSDNSEYGDYDDKWKDAWALDECGALSACSYAGSRLAFWRLRKLDLPFRPGTYIAVSSGLDKVSRAVPFNLELWLKQAGVTSTAESKWSQVREAFCARIAQLEVDQFNGLMTCAATLVDQKLSFEVRSEILSLLGERASKARLPDILSAFTAQKPTWGSAAAVVQFLNALKQHPDLVSATNHDQRHAIGKTLMQDQTVATVKRITAAQLKALHAAGCFPEDVAAYDRFLLLWFEKGGHVEGILDVLRTVKEWKIQGEILRLAWPKLYTDERAEVLMNTTKAHWELEGCLDILNPKELRKLVG